MTCPLGMSIGFMTGRSFQTGSGTFLGTVHPCVVDAGTDVVDGLAFFKLGRERQQEADEAFFHHFFGEEPGLLFHHLHHDTCQLGSRPALADEGEIAAEER